MRRVRGLTVTFREAVPQRPGRLDDALCLGERLIEGHPQAGRCELTINNNRRRVLSWRTRHSTLQVSVHHGLLAQQEEVAAVVLRRDPDAWQRLRSGFAPAPVAAVVPGRSLGRHHDLQRLLDQVVQQQPQPCPAPPIGWGMWPTRAPRRGLRLGSCSGDPPALRVHPVLDHASVPEWFVSFVVFHELLHVLIPPTRGPSGRRRVHGPAFRARERAHPDCSRADLWEQENIHRLLRRCRDHVNSGGSRNHLSDSDIEGSGRST